MDRTFGNFLRIMQHCMRLDPRHQRPISLISPISKHLAGIRQTNFTSCRNQLTASQPINWQFRINALNPATNCQCQWQTLSRGIVKRTMRFHMMQTVSLDKSLQCRNLIGNHVLHVFQLHVHVPTTKANPVWITGMGTDSHAIFFSNCYRLSHNVGITSMKPTGNVGRSNQRQNLFIISQDIMTKAFTQITVQINFHFAAPFLNTLANVSASASHPTS